MYWWENVGLVPRLIDEFAAADDTTFAGFATDYFFDPAYESQAHGMGTAIWCNDDYGFLDPAMPARQKDRYPLLGEWIGLVEAFTIMCEGWPLKPPDPGEWDINMSAMMNHKSSSNSMTATPVNWLTQRASPLLMPKTINRSPPKKAAGR